MAKFDATWRPLLDAELAEEAWLILHQISDELSGLSGSLKDPSLTRGSAGIALFFHYLHLSTSDKAQINCKTVRKFLTRTMNLLKGAPIELSFGTGLAGIAWVNEHLQRQQRPIPAVDAHQEIDELLLAVLSAPWTGPFDLIEGLVGIGTYSLERLPRPSAKQCLKLILDKLDEMAVHQRDELSWLTSGKILPPARLHYLDGYYDLGIAHGNAGVIGLLNGIVAHGLEKKRAYNLMKKAVRWMIAQQLPQGSNSYFTSFATSTNEVRRSRLAWCYGDLGICSILRLSATIAKRRDWQEFAAAVALRAVKRAPSESGVIDCGLCHGSAGVGHLFNRLYQSTGLDEYRAAARLWFIQTFAMRKKNSGIAGFTAIHGGQILNEPGMLMGVAGIGLALLAAVSNTPPEWDRALLISHRNDLTRLNANC